MENEIQTPEIEIVKSIVVKKAEALNLKLDVDAVEFIANKYKTNKLQIEQAIKRIYELIDLTFQQITFTINKNMVKEILYFTKPIYNNNMEEVLNCVESIPPERIVEEVSRATGVSIDDIYSKKRNINISKAKDICFYIINSITDANAKEIADIFKVVDETVTYRINKVKEELNCNLRLNYLVENIINEIKNEMI